MMRRCRFATERVSVLLPDERTYAAACAELPGWRRSRCDAFCFKADRRRSVAAWLLLKRLLGLSSDDFRAAAVSENEFGKPAFCGFRGVHFNLSHSGDRVMAVVGDVPVGCDVERVSPVQMDVADGCLAPDERAYIASFPVGELRDRAFTRVWVRKESYAKALGKGAALGFETCSVLPASFPPGWRCEDFDCGDGYLGAVTEYAVEASGVRLPRPECL